MQQKNTYEKKDCKHKTNAAKNRNVESDFVFCSFHKVLVNNKL